MFASATSGERPNNSRFSNCSVGNISSVLDAIEEGKKKNCFTGNDRVISVDRADQLMVPFSFFIILQIGRALSAVTRLSKTARNVIAATMTMSAKKSVVIRASSANRIEPSTRPLKDANVDQVRNE